MAFIKFKPLAPTFNFFGILSPEDLEVEFKHFISNDEKITIAFKTNRDICIFTNYRILLIDRKGIRGFRRVFTTILYKSISSLDIAVENIDAKITMVLNSGYILKLNFLKPIPLNTMYNVYNFIFDKIKE